MHFSFLMAKRILSLGSSSFLISLSSILVSQGLIIAVGTFTNTINAGIYGVVMMVMTNISFLLTKITQPMVTLSSEMFAKKSYKQLNQLILFLMRLSLVISFLFSVSLFFYIEDLLKILLSVNWDNQDYINASLAIFIMSIAVTIGIPQFVSRAVLERAISSAACRLFGRKPTSKRRSIYSWCWQGYTRWWIYISTETLGAWSRNTCKFNKQ